MATVKYSGFLGPTYSGRSISISPDRCINFYPELVETGLGKNRACLIGTPGLRAIAQTGREEPIRGICTKGGRVLIAGLKHIYELNRNMTVTELGEIAPDPVYEGLAPVTFAYNGNQYCISSGSKGYILTGGAIQEIAFPAIDQVVFIDGYFVALSLAERKIYISALYDGTSWDPLDFKMKESAPDRPNSIVADHGELWVFGEETAEVWYNSGNADFPFERAQGGRLELGCAAPWSPAKLDNSLFWVGNDERGNRVVWRADGYQARRVSTHAIEYRMNLMSPRVSGSGVMDSTTTFAVGWAYQEEGHSFYCLIFPNAMKDMSRSVKEYTNPTMFVYDCATQLWHERAWWNKALGRFEPPRQRCHGYIWDHHLVGDRENGKIYEQHLDYYDDAGDPIRRERIGPVISQDNKMLYFNSFILDMEVAVGLGMVDSEIYGKDSYGMEYKA